MSMGTSNISTSSYSRLRKKKADVFKVGARDLDYLIGAVEEALKLYDKETLDRAWGMP
jgi:hypothetical protein